MRRIYSFVILVSSLLIAGNSAAQSANQAAQRRVFNPGPAISVTSPKGGESFKVGSNLTVAWKFSGIVGSSAKVFLHKNSTPSADQLLATVTLDSTGAGACSVPIPKESVPGSDYTIVVVSSQSPSIKSESGPISLVEGGMTYKRREQPIAVGPVKGATLPMIVVTQPAGDKAVNGGSSFQITWTNKSSDTAFLVKISLYKGDALQKLLAPGVPVSQGSFNWAVPGDIEYSDQYQIHIASATAEKKYYGWSEFFPIFGLPTISSFSPTAAATGDVVSIVGKNFTGADYSQGGDVLIGNTNGIQVKVVSDTLIQAKVAWTATDGPVVVETAGGKAQVAGFTKLYSLGDSLQGGKVVYTDSTRRHGLIAADEDCCKGCGDPHGCCQTCTWADANAKCQQPQDGTSGWRLPSQSELITLFTAYESGKTHLDMHGGYACLLWSSTSGPTNDTAHVLLNPYTDHVWQKTYMASARAVKTF